MDHFPCRNDYYIDIGIYFCELYMESSENSGIRQSYMFSCENFERHGTKFPLFYPDDDYNTQSSLNYNNMNKQNLIVKLKMTDERKEMYSL